MPRDYRAHFRLRFGLCCQFVREPIRFRTTTATSLLRREPEERRQKLSHLCLVNAESLREALEFCASSGIGSFRIPSSILPVKTHPQAGYVIDDLPDAARIIAAFRDCGRFADEHDIRTVFHPDQFVVLNSPNDEVVRKSLADLEYHAQVADWVGADVINIHAGGAYGDKPAALARFSRNVDRLSDAARTRLTIENDDTIYAPIDLLPISRTLGLPMVYDVHHHRCHSDGMSIEDATDLALGTWDREPLFHISSPADGWNGSLPKRHHADIDPRDFPDCWRNLSATVEVEAKSKELAVFRLRAYLLKPIRPRSCRKRRPISRGGRHGR